MASALEDVEFFRVPFAFGLSAARSVTLDWRGIIGPVFLYARLEVTPTIGVIRSLRFLQAAFEDRDAKHCTGQSGLAGMGNHIAE